MDMNITILGFTGSLRQNSYNKAALNTAKKLLPEGSSLELADLSLIPFFNEDLEIEGIPPVVAEFRKKIASADALLISTPEYNYSIPPVLKNALDWASRDKERPLNGKLLAIVSASPSMFGGARAQYHLRQVCVVLNLWVLNKPEVFITNADKKFDQEGNLTDDYTRKALSQLLQALVDKAREFKKK